MNGACCVGQRNRTNSLDQFVDLFPTGSSKLFHNAFAAKIKHNNPIKVMLYFILNLTTSILFKFLHKKNLFAKYKHNFG